VLHRDFYQATLFAGQNGTADGSISAGLAGLGALLWTKTVGSNATKGRHLAVSPGTNGADFDDLNRDCLSPQEGA
jgi:hypothetical protein